MILLHSLASSNKNIDSENSYRCLKYTRSFSKISITIHEKREDDHLANKIMKTVTSMTGAQ